jgi:hypothetical protein
MKKRHPPPNGGIFRARNTACQHKTRHRDYPAAKSWTIHVVFVGSADNSFAVRGCRYKIELCKRVKFE